MAMMKIARGDMLARHRDMIDARRITDGPERLPTDKDYSLHCRGPLHTGVISQTAGWWPHVTPDYPRCLNGQ